MENSLIIPADKNTRAEAMWRIISQEVDFRKKRVIDFGCGTGDFLWRAYVAGAEHVIGIDNKTEVETIFVDDGEDYTEGIIRMRTGINLFFSWDIDEEINKAPNDYINSFDIALCFSVLPYLSDIPATLKWMSANFSLSIIEAQYNPEPYNVGVLSDTGMAQLLLNNGFDTIEPIGKTYVEIRDVYRTIWKCE